MNRTLFYSKILLFGEYGIVRQSKGLAIPYEFYKGMLVVDTPRTRTQKKSNNSLLTFYNYLQSEVNSKLIYLNLNQFKKDILQGMYFDSTIPQGYGIGSSGALVAAIYDKYALKKIHVLEDMTKANLLKLKSIFSEMESFFHGNSSGIDPLNSYLSIPILINSKNNIELTGLPFQKEKKATIFLLDTGITGETAPMVSLFINKMKQQKFRDMLNTEFIKNTELCIEHFIKGDMKSLLKNVKKLSDIVLKNFKPMIPEKIRSIWQQGIDTNTYFLKLCGSGGGGYMLGFTEDFEKTKKLLKDYKLERVHNL